VTDEGLCRVGWSTLKATLDLGTDKEGFGFGGTSKKSFGRQFDTYGEVRPTSQSNFTSLVLQIRCCCLAMNYLSNQCDIHALRLLQYVQFFMLYIVQCSESYISVFFVCLFL